MPYALYKTEYVGRDKKEIFVDVVSKKQMVQIFPIFNETIECNHFKSGRKIPQNFYMEITPGCARALRRGLKEKKSTRKSLAACVEE